MTLGSPLMQCPVEGSTPEHKGAGVTAAKRDGKKKRKMRGPWPDTASTPASRYKSPRAQLKEEVRKVRDDRFHGSG